ncbi:MAG: hypothetical protein ABIF11_07880 [Nitrospirota bacterium]
MNTKIRKLKEKSGFTTHQISQKGDEVYQRVRGKLEEKHKGEFVLIEPETGDYFIGKDQLEIVFQAKKKYPEKVFRMIRIGYPASHKLRGERGDKRLY